MKKNVLLAFIAFISYVTTNAQTWQIGDPIASNVTASLSNDTLTISGTGRMKDFPEQLSSPWSDVREKIKALVIQNGITTIGNYAFYSCYALKGSLIIPGSVTRIGNEAFTNCRLTSVTIPNSVISIGDFAFDVNIGLTTVNIPSSVTSIGEGAFSCGGLTLTAINVDAANTAYCSVDGILYNKGKTILLQCPDGFKGSLIIPGSVTRIAYTAFSRCEGLTSVTIPNGVTSIEKYAFPDCIGLKSLVIPSSVTSIGEGAFRYCRGLTSVTIPNSVTNIGNEAFLGCRELTNVSIPVSVSIIGNGAFANCNNLVAINVDAANLAYCSTDGILYNKNKTLLVQCPAGFKGSLIIPGSVTGIAEQAFAYCWGLTSVTIPNSVNSIGTNAFIDCGFTEIISLNPTPPVLGSSVFYWVDKTKCTLKVPAGSKTAYKGAYEWTDFVNIVEMQPTDIGIISASKVEVYPNPVVNDLFIMSDWPVKKVEIYNVAGCKLIDNTINSSMQKEIQTIKVSILGRGIYFMKIFIDNTSFTKKFEKE